MRQTYGLTEAPVITILEPHEHDPPPADPPHVRTAAPGTEVEVRDEHGVRVAAGPDRRDTRARCVGDDRVLG